MHVRSVMASARSYAAFRVTIASKLRHFRDPDMTPKRSISAPIEPESPSATPLKSAETPAETPFIVDDILDDEGGPPTSNRSWWVAGSLAVFAAIAPYLWFSWHRPAPNPAPAVVAADVPAAPRLGFRASRESGDWRLAWDREAIAKLQPVGAMLAINDGGADRVQFLSPVDLDSGSI